MYILSVTVHSCDGVILSLSLFTGKIWNSSSVQCMIICVSSFKICVDCNNNIVLTKAWATCLHKNVCLRVQVEQKTHSPPYCKPTVSQTKLVIASISRVYLLFLEPPNCHKHLIFFFPPATVGSAVIDT